MMFGKKYQVTPIPKYAWVVGDILTAEYITEYLGVATVETNAIRKEAGFDGKFTYGMENILVAKTTKLKVPIRARNIHKNQNNIILEKLTED